MKHTLIIHGNSDYMNAPRCDVILTFPALLDRCSSIKNVSGALSYAEILYLVILCLLGLNQTLSETGKLFIIRCFLIDLLHRQFIQNLQR